MSPGASGRAASAVLAAILVPGCAATWRQDAPPGPAAWAEQLRGQGLDPASVQDPLAATDEMRGLARQIDEGGQPLDRLARLQAYLFDSSRFSFDYDSRSTLTAAEAFARREGNCVSFTNLFISLARSMGIPVRAAMVLRVRDAERDGDLVVINTHVVATYPAGSRLAVFDFYRTRREEPLSLRILDDLAISAIYQNNLGVAQLRSGRLDDAIGRFESAVRLSPDFVGAFANLGVARRRAGDAVGALEAYLMALQLEPNDPSTRNDLAILYAEMARHDETGGSARAAPLLAQGDAAMSRGEVRRALALYRDATRITPWAAAPLVSVARAELLHGDLRAARRALLRAIRLDPSGTTGASASRLLETLDRTARAARRRPAEVVIRDRKG